jgi:glycosyltransferase involved in cell wall biosynthesis
MKTVVLRAPILTSSGYGVHGRQIAKWLLAEMDKRPTELDVYFDVVPWGMTPWIVNQNFEDGLVKRIIERSQKKEHYDLSLQLQLPNEWNPFLADKNIGLTAAVETNLCNPDWIPAVNRMDMVIVPSEFTKQCFENTTSETNKLTTTIQVVPESWFEECRTAVRGISCLEDKLNLTTDFNFLVVSQFTGNNPENDRKNIAYTIKWLMEEFANTPGVGVVIKTNFGRLTTIDKQNSLRVLSQLVYETRKGPWPNVYLLHGAMNNKEMVGLYTHPKIKALVNLSAGEGFGLPLLEAAACGLPVVATNWSAHTEFLNKGKFVKIDYGLQQIHQSRVDKNIFMSNAKWARPDEVDAKKKLKKFFESSRTPEEWAKDLQVKIRADYSPEAIEACYRELIEL